MIRIITILAVFGITLAARSELDWHWEQFKNVHGKQYGKEEEAKRRLIWEDNVDFITKHNLEADLGKHTYTVAVNKFADLTTEEFKKIYNGRKSSSGRPNKVLSQQFLHQANPADQLPATVDWRDKGYVTPVKDQGQCGSCWSFSATGSMEGQHFRSTGNLVSLSEQNLMDCSTAEGNEGCNGGLEDDAFRYVISNGGVNSEADYPYQASDGSCRYNPNDVAATLSSYKVITAGSESDLKSAVATVGPVSIGIDASQQSFQLYSSGVYNEPNCGKTDDELDHSVLAVGYGTENGVDYWLVKNSWGTSWGENGYIKMSRNADNQCGIATEASYPVV